ncbi:sensor domain-containing diguanylate cyclase [Alkalihalobacterium alkalinitrilicum]|uniref:sensor domain-containing diguanylate cyclase n=1 Tax=Alkalihalobacterium alkalinitrilicum TaxID=427920 RepID=UPI0009953429|nr:diguanylate cyclase [Alkalihalobacterium alkalinitrilicum]
MIATYSSDMITVHDAKGTYLYVSPAGEEILQYSSDEVIGKDSYTFIHPDDQEICMKNHQILLEEKYVVSTYRIRSKDGEYIWFESSLRCLPGREPNEPQIIVISRNITERKRMEKKLQEIEELFQMITEYSSDMITIHNAAGEYLYISLAVKEILQFDNHELIGKDGYFFIHPDDQALVGRNHQYVMKKGFGVATYRIQRKDGQYVWFESTVRYLPGRDPGEPQILVMSRDITKRKIEEQKLQKANEKLLDLTNKDGLTGIGNRRYFDETLKKEWQRALVHSRNITLIMADIDYFKPYNDTYGHHRGDECLKQVASAIQNTLMRQGDVVCRYGGEEFAVILPDTNEKGAKHVSENIRESIVALQIPHAGSKISNYLTISLGTATLIPKAKANPKVLIEAADKVLYQAKQEGRNCVRSL